MSLDHCSLSEAHFVTLPSQSNIYGLATLCLGGTNKVLVASLRRQVICVEYVHNKPSEILIPASKEVHFTYIPGGAEIISIDSFNKSLSSNDFIVGITFSKPTDTPAVQYFNVYTDWEPKSELSLDSIAQSCLSLKLNFIPYQLYHTEFWKDGHREMVWLLSGSDGEIHLYQEDKAQHTYCEHSVAEHFPEFHDLKRIVLWMSVAYYENQQKRLSAIGCEDGYLQATVTRVETKEILQKWNLKHDSPISCVKTFCLNTDLEQPTFLVHAENSECANTFPEENGAEADPADPAFHLLVISSLEVAVIYWCSAFQIQLNNWNVLTDGFAHQRLLPGSDEFDCVQCACVADIDMDGVNEIVIGTYGQELLVYKYDDEGEFHRVWQHSFAYPLLSIDYLDITGDGLRELIVLSTKGLHIFQHDLKQVAELLTRRLARLVRNINKDDAFKELQSEQLEQNATNNK